MANWRKLCSSLRELLPEAARRPASHTLWIALLAAGCGQAGEPQPAAATDPGTPAQCVPAAEGLLRARLQGSIDAEIDWSVDVPHCRGSVRPRGEGLRLVFRGEAPGAGPLLIVFGLANLLPGESAANVPANLTVVREGAGQFFATQGADKCFFDTIRQAPVDGQPALYRLDGRGYCLQPARAVGGEGAVLVSRFDVVALVEQPAADAPEATSAATQSP